MGAPLDYGGAPSSQARLPIRVMLPPLAARDVGFIAPIDVHDVDLPVTVAEALEHHFGAIGRAGWGIVAVLGPVGAELALLTALQICTPDPAFSSEYDVSTRAPVGIPPGDATAYLSDVGPVRSHREETVVSGEHDALSIG